MSPQLSANTRFDLHMHSTRSDGALEPVQVLEKAARNGLDVIALTDHDLGSGLQAGVHQVADRRIRVIAGAEISGVHEGREYHLLVYFPEEMPQAFREFCAALAQARVDRYEQALDSLRLDGLERPDALARAGERAVTRHHLSRALVEAGHARDLPDAFARYTGFRHGHVPQVTLPFVDAIRIARAHGAVTSWAHPQVSAVEDHLGTFVAAGLQGLEAVRPHVRSTDRRRLKRLARRHGLFVSGGSDYHGWSGPDLGTFAVFRDELRGFVETLDEAA